MYQVAHRYSMRNLAALSLEHIMSTLTPESCFAMLLASYTWDELHTMVEVYFRSPQPFNRLIALKGLRDREVG